MLPLIINNVEVNLPTSWDEVTWNQYMELQKGEINELRLLSALTGIDYDTICNVDASAFDKYIPLLSFASEPLNLAEIKRAESITLRGIKLTVPADPGAETLGQKLFLQSQIRIKQEQSESLLPLMPLAIAIYLQPKLTGKYIEKEVLSLVDEISAMPLTVVYPTGNFFLTLFLKHLN